MNPCPCGFHGDTTRTCRCTPDQIARYRGRLSGPFLDRIDLIVDVPALAPDVLANKVAGENSANVRARVEIATQRQQARQGKANARLATGEIDAHCQPDAAGLTLLQQATTRLGLSARAWHRVLKVARSIADLAGEPQVRAPHVAEAIQYRRFPHA